MPGGVKPWTIFHKAKYEAFIEGAKYQKIMNNLDTIFDI